ncbi:MAG: SPASM domain-containing protein [Spirochaetes bacterium]|nr:SPASM domain-containing protein [Spirochaetota bacterium]
MLRNLPALQRIVLLGFGEALCNPLFIDHLTALKSCNAKIVLVSNAHFINAKIAEFLVKLPIDELWISWDDDPTTPATIRRNISPTAIKEKIAAIVKTRNAHTTSLPKLGMEIVAMRTNATALSKIINFGKNIGIEQFIISNLFPYSESLQSEILYSQFTIPEIMLSAIVPKILAGLPARIAHQNADTLRCCPFIEKGTIFITAMGNIAPCLELAYTHPAWYFGSKRMHRALYFGNIRNTDLDNSWNCPQFADFRKKFEYYEFPDCSLCHQPNMCWHRTVDIKDCYGNETPCGECLWAKNIIICP